MEISAESLTSRQHYALMTSIVVPRPIAWIGTRGARGDNLAPFSYFMGVSSDPPLVAVSIVRKRGGELKDTLRNLIDTQRCTLSLVSVPQLADMHGSSKPLDLGQDEFEHMGIEKRDLQGMPAVMASTSVMLCSLERSEDLGSTHLVLLRVQSYFVDPRAYNAESGRMDSAAIEPLGRLAGAYAGLGPELLP